MPARPSSRAAHHGCGLSRDVTTKSVRSLPQLEQRNLRRVSGTSPRPASMSFCRSASAWCCSRLCTRGERRDVARSQRGPWRRQAAHSSAPRSRRAIAAFSRL